jgi:hypothetical protein
MVREMTKIGASSLSSPTVCKTFLILSIFPFRASESTSHSNNALFSAQVDLFHFQGESWSPKWCCSLGRRNTAARNPLSCHSDEFNSMTMVNTTRNIQTTQHACSKGATQWVIGSCRGCGSSSVDEVGSLSCSRSIVPYELIEELSTCCVMLDAMHYISYDIDVGYWVWAILAWQNRRCHRKKESDCQRCRVESCFMTPKTSVEKNGIGAVTNPRDF